MGAIPKDIKDEIHEMLDNGRTPEQIMAVNPKYDTYRAYIAHLFMRKRRNEIPALKKMRNEWHICSPDIEEQLCTEWCSIHAKDSVYVCSDSRNLSFDGYTGTQSSVFIKNFKGSIDYGNLMGMLDAYIDMLSFGYSDIYPLWDTCIITSPLPPEIICNDIYGSIVSPLLGQLYTITYHYKEAGMDDSYTMLADEYRCFADLKRLAENYKCTSLY